LESRDLRYFVQVARCGSFNKAAGRLGVAQPALSRHVKSLEFELGVKLFDRTNRGVEQTEAGQRLFKIASTIIRDIEAIPGELRRSAPEPSGPLSLGVPTSLAYLLTAAICARVLVELPKVKFTMLDGQSPVLCDGVENATTDMALLIETPQLDLAHRDVVWIELAREDIVLVGEPSLLSAGRRTVSLRELETIPFVTAPGYLALLEPMLHASGAKPVSVVTLNSVASIRAAIREGRYCALVPYALVHHDVICGHLRALTFADIAPTRRIILCHGPGGPATKALQTLQRILKEELERLPLRIGAVSGKSAIESFSRCA
jgi:LysR family transcriptional regulator, nitrogen assimilation regulatory protein